MIFLFFPIRFKKNGNNLVIKRILSHGSTLSRWELNGRPSNANAVITSIFNDIKSYLKILYS